MNKLKFKDFFLNEARRNPEINIRKKAVDIISKYQNRPDSEDIFIHFTKMNKLGINPDSYFWLIGLHCYQINNIGGYAANYPYFYIFKAKNKNDIIYLNTEKDVYNKIYLKIKDLVKNDYNIPETELEIIGQRSCSLHELLGNIIDYIRDHSQNNVKSPKGRILGYKLLTKAGIKGVVDLSGNGLIIRDISSQAWFSDVQQINILTFNKQYMPYELIQTDNPKNKFIKSHKQSIRPILKYTGHFCGNN